MGQAGPFIHPLASVSSKLIGSGTQVWQFAVVMTTVRIGTDCNIGAQTFIENGVTLGNRVTIKNGVQLWEGTIIEDDVFIGPNVTFTNDRYPISGNAEFSREPVTIRSGASVGGGAVLLPGIVVGRNALVGAGAVVTRDVIDNGRVVGNPARPL